MHTPFHQNAAQKRGDNPHADPDGDPRQRTEALKSVVLGVAGAGISAPAPSTTVSTPLSGLSLIGRPRTAMSRSVTVLSAVMPAAPAIAPRRNPLLLEVLYPPRAGPPRCRTPSGG